MAQALRAAHQAIEMETSADALETAAAMLAGIREVPATLARHAQEVRQRLG